MTILISLAWNLLHVLMVQYSKLGTFSQLHMIERLSALSESMAINVFLQSGQRRAMLVALLSRVKFVFEFAFPLLVTNSSPRLLSLLLAI